MVKSNRGKIQGKDAKIKATDGRPIYIRMYEAMIDEGGPGSGRRPGGGSSAKKDYKAVSGFVRAKQKVPLSKPMNADTYNKMKKAVIDSKSAPADSLAKKPEGKNTDIFTYVSNIRLPQNHPNYKKPKTESQEGAGTYGPAAFLNQVFTRVKPKNFSKAKPKETAPVESKKTEDIDQTVANLLSNNPTMSSSTFLNLLKSQGIKFTKEADSASAMPGLVRGKESAISFRAVRFLEKGELPKTIDVGIEKPKDKYLGFTKFRSVLLQEGLGNFGDAYFYSASALQSAAPIFEGKKIFADHPSSLDEQTRPERSVRDVLGHFENVHVEVADDGRSQLVGDVVVLPDDSFKWARSLMSHAIEFHEKFPDKEFIGLSINASGDAEPVSLDEFMKNEMPESVKLKLTEAVEKGIKEIKVVSTINEAVSCDLVTEAGAGGSLKNYLESKTNLNHEGENMKKKIKENEKEVVEKKESEGEEMPAAGDHADAAQDIELIKSMLKKSFGGEEDPSEEECAMAKEACEAYGEMGDDKEKAMEKAMEFMKASKHLASKQMKKEADAELKDEEKKDEPVEESADEETPVKESAKNNDEVIKLRGVLAKYKEQDKKRSIANHIDKICKESKKSNAFTSEFRAVVKDAKSVEEVDRSWKIFEAAAKATGTSSVDLFEGITFATEKTASFVESNTTALSFDDCKVY